MTEREFRQKIQELMKTIVNEEELSNFNSAVREVLRRFIDDIGYRQEENDEGEERHHEFGHDEYLDAIYSGVGKLIYEDVLSMIIGLSKDLPEGKREALYSAAVAAAASFIKRRHVVKPTTSRHSHVIGTSIEVGGHQTHFVGISEGFSDNLAEQIKRCPKVARSYGHDIVVVYWKDGWKYQRISNHLAMTRFDKKSNLYTKIAWHRLSGELLNLSEFQE